MRIFVAIEITDKKVVESIAKFQNKIHISAKPVESNNFHFTLQFLGEVSEKNTREIIQILDTIKFSSFDVNLKGVGTFPKMKSPRVIWIGTDEHGGKLLVELSKKIRELLGSLGFFSDKPFKPHITVFRIKKKIGDLSCDLKSIMDTDFGMQKICSVKLKKSELTSSGPIYSDLMEIKAQK
jgi:2'-5' RNA ligase